MNKVRRILTGKRVIYLANYWDNENFSTFLVSTGRTALALTVIPDMPVHGDIGVFTCWD